VNNRHKFNFGPPASANVLAGLSAGCARSCVRFD